MWYQDIEDSRMYQRAEQVADQVWQILTNTPDTLFNELVTLGQELNAYIRSQRNRTLKESSILYDVSNPGEPTN